MKKKYLMLCILSLSMYFMSLGVQIKDNNYIYNFNMTIVSFCYGFGLSLLIWFIIEFIEFLNNWCDKK